MDYRPFIYGGLASMTAEFGEKIDVFGNCFAPEWASRFHRLKVEGISDL